MNRKAWLVPLSITLGLSWLALTNVDLLRLRDLLSGARLRWLPVMTALLLLEVALRAQRWSLLLGGKPRADAWRLFGIDAIGSAVNNILFLRLGELARALLAARRLSLPLATVLASIAVERALDLSALLATFAIASALAPDLVPGPVRRMAFLVLTGAIAALAALAAAERPLAQGAVLDRRLSGWPRLQRLVRELSTGAAVLRSVASAAQVTLLSAAFWSVDVLYYWAAARCLALTPELTGDRAMLVVSWAGAGTALPAAPGAFGTFELAVKKIVVDMGVDPSLAFGYAFFSHIIGYCMLTAVGLGFLCRTGVSWAELRSELSHRDPGTALAAER